MSVTFGLPRPWLSNPKFRPPRFPVARELIPPPPKPRAVKRRISFVPLAEAPLAPRAKIPPSAIDRILRVACTLFGCTKAELCGERRSRLLVAARLYASVRMSRELGVSTTGIGKVLGGRDHTTILHLLKKAEGIKKRRAT